MRLNTSAIVVALALASAAHASMSYTGTQLVESFDTLGKGTLAANGTVSPAPLSATTNTHVAIPGVSFEATRIAGTSTTALPYLVDSGAGNSGAIYNYGETFAATDRLLGSVASGSNTPAFGVEIVNNAAYALTEFTITADAMQFRSSTITQNVLKFAYGFSGGATSSDYLSSAALTTLSTGDVVGQAPVATNGALTPPAALASISVTITGLNVAPGSSIYFRWQDTNDGGNDGGLSINNFTFSAVPTPGAAALMGLAGLVAVRRRRA